MNKRRIIIFRGVHIQLDIKRIRIRINKKSWIRIIFVYSFPRKAQIPDISKEERKEGRKEGRKERKKEGRKEGKKEGREEGKKERRKEGKNEIKKEGGKKDGRKWSQGKEGNDIFVF